MNKTITYNKLIRDNITEIIQKSGKSYDLHQANDQEYQDHLFMKLVEESKEMAESPCMEELADILEVIEAIKDLYAFKDEDIERIKAEKKANRGGFSKRLILDKVYESEVL